MGQLVKKLQLTSPGVLLIIAVLAASGIILLDSFYLQPYMSRQKDAAFREQAGKVANTGRLALRTEGAALLSICSDLIHDPRVTESLLSQESQPEQFAEFAEEKLKGKTIELAWLSDDSGRIIALWSEPFSNKVRNVPGLIPATLKRQMKQLSRMENLPETALIKVSNRVAMFVRRPISYNKDQLSATGHLWLAMDLDSNALARIGSNIGGKLVLVGEGKVPPGAFSDKSATHMLWSTGRDYLAVAWLAQDATGKMIGCFLADVPVVQIYRQSIAARRMILIILSLSVGVVLLVILGTHILISGPVIRLLKRLPLVEAGEAEFQELTHDLHGEPLVLARRLESAFDKLDHMSKTDELTGLANRRHLEEVLECFYSQARRYNRPLSLIVMDLDFFKAVNDAGGHRAGDNLLKAVASSIEKTCRKADLPARLGGDEFAVLLPETNIDDAAIIAERIRKSVYSADHTVKTVQTNISISVGLADLNSAEIDSGEAMLAMADRALYRAKSTGRNRVVKAHELDGAVWSGPSDEGRASTLCKKLAGLDNQFKTLFLQAVEEIMDILEQRDPYMADHARKVQRYAVMLAKELQLPDRIVKRVEIASMLHDIGMLAMPDSVLLCTTELDPEKLDLMRKHPLYSVRIMEGMEFLEQEIPAVRYHHERYDGQGYPEGLSGSAIPLSARIISVADAFDAMTSPRTFRNAKSQAEALLELQRVAGTQLDPTIVEAFLALASRMSDELMCNGQRHSHEETSPSNNAAEEI